MSRPPAIVTRTVNLGPGIVLEDGTPLTIRAKVKASRSLVWRATGTPLRAAGSELAAEPGVEAALDLPVTDQDGWSDGKG
ncbi:MAG: hypothetical protein JWP56_3144, partial [Aeromicrobium sp.]|nr:hypothetical protein [Aeromicrobium sp.]